MARTLCTLDNQGYTPTRPGTQARARARARAQAHKYVTLFLFDINNDFAKTSQYYVILTLPVWFGTWFNFTL